MFENHYESLRAEAREAIIDYLENNERFYLCDMHNEIFNTDYYTLDKDKAIEIIADNDIYQSWKTVGEIIEYEKDNFGELYTDVSDPVKVCNMLYYLIGEDELYKMFDGCELFEELWNEEVTEEDCNKLVKWIYDHGRN